MATDIARYQFQSWVRKGISTRISETDTLGAGPPPASERATVAIGVTINTAPSSPKPFALVGPGDIIGVHRDMVVRCEPRDGTVNFEPNYLAFIEFYDEDFAWRYTPARPDGERLRPWLQLLVLKPGEFDRDDRRLPLPVVAVKSKEALPRADESWLFAHAHLEQPIPAAELSTLERYLLALEGTLTTDPDRMYCRLMSPRHLDPNTAYQAFLVPAFEAGRLAGLDRPATGVPAQQPAWDGSAGAELPFYYSWSFRTGDAVDFEALVELLEPRALDPRIGIRPMDCSRPGFVQADLEGHALPGSPPLPAPEPPLQGLEGALRTGNTKPLPPAFTPNAFQDALQVLVNLPETIVADTGAIAAPVGPDDDFSADPVVTLPFYGQNHARQHRTDQVLLDVLDDGWYHDLNRDPRTRAAAGLGTVVVQSQQERLMQRAWQQVQKVFEANRQIRHVQFVLQVSLRYSAKFFATLPPPRLLAVTSAIHARVLGSPTTIRHQLRESRLLAPVFSPAFRRLTRPHGALAQRLGRAGTPLDFGALVDAVNSGRADPAQPRVVPAGLPSVDDLAGGIAPPLPRWLQWLVDHRDYVLLAWLVLAGLFGVATGAWPVAIVFAVAGVVLHRWLAWLAARKAAAAVLTDPAQGQAAIAAVPPRPGFQISLDGEAAPPPATPGASADADSVEAANFRAAALQLWQRLDIRLPAPPPRKAFDLAHGAASVALAIDPRVSFPRRLAGMVELPGLSLSKPEEIVDAMACPDFEDAMYAALRDLGKELLIPNLDLIPPNTISLLETNPRFIESFMVGLNHEMARELLWREYPTDLRGTCFRQFWEVKGVSNPDTPADANALKDITRIHTWRAASALGAHKPPPSADADVPPGGSRLVLVIRGDLLRRYPNTVIYAQKAMRDEAGNRVIATWDLSPADFDVQLKFPLFRAEIDPDLRFFGFDLTLEQARGSVDSRHFPGDRDGWFFVLQEVPGEPRFGMDLSYSPTQDTKGKTLPNTWNNLAWTQFGATPPAFVTRTPPKMPAPHDADLTDHAWAANAAEMAYILFQTPAMVAIHASEMLAHA